MSNLTYEVGRNEKMKNGIFKTEFLCLGCFQEEKLIWKEIATKVSEINVTGNARLADEKWTYLSSIKVGKKMASE